MSVFEGNNGHNNFDRSGYHSQTGIPVRQRKRINTREPTVGHNTGQCGGHDGSFLNGQPKEAEDHSSGGSGDVVLGHGHHYRYDHPSHFEQASRSNWFGHLGSAGWHRFLRDR